MDVKKSIGERLKKLREERKEADSRFTQQYIADYLGVSRVAYGKKETGENPFTTEELLLLANLYDVTVDFLLGNKEIDQEQLKIDKNARELLELLNTLDEKTRANLSRDILTFSKGYIQARMNNDTKAE